MNIEPSVVVLILAGGRSERFFASGGTTHKLDAMLEGKSVLSHVIQSVEGSGLKWHLFRPKEPTSGMGSTIAMAVKQWPQAFGWLLLPGDLPLITSASIQKIGDCLTHWSIVVPRCSHQRGHPVGFRSECFEALTQLNGQEGASSVVRSYRQKGQVLDLDLDDEGIYRDIDTVDDLKQISVILQH